VPVVSVILIVLAVLMAVETAVAILGGSGKSTPTKATGPAAAD